MKKERVAAERQLAADVAALRLEVIRGARRAAAFHPIAFVTRATLAGTITGCRAWGHFFGSVTALGAVFATCHALCHESPSDTGSAGLRQVNHCRFLHAREALARAIMGGGACRVPICACTAIHARRAAVVAPRADTAQDSAAPPPPSAPDAPCSPCL